MIVQPLASITVTWFVYGFYIALFIVALNNLYKYRRENRRLYLAWTVLLFFLCTLNNVFETWYRVRQAIKIYTGEHTKDYPTLQAYAQHDLIKTVQRLVGFLMILPIVANLVAESMLIHRCYVVWFGNKWVGITLLVLSVVLNSVGLAGCIMFTIGFRDTRFPEHIALLLKGNNINNGYLIANVIFNSLLTALTAGRIYAISREARKFLGDDGINKTYKTVVAVIIESGLIYPTSLIIYIVILLRLDPNNQSLLPVDLSPLFMQAAGIAPTLIIVRALQGKTTDSVDQVVSANNHDRTRSTATTRSRIRFAPGGRGATSTTTTDGQVTHHAVDLPDGHSGMSSGDIEKMEGTQSDKEQV
ncbi:hypothetical protein AAF712_007659 [Marasmius tenuissimus]|uniref:Gustatory receptor n=1 Tax=Marasmius tenuissimus TaxID=585030 RepID=A0ABR2ZYF1_9AGAR